MFFNSFIDAFLTLPGRPHQSVEGALRARPRKAKAPFWRPQKLLGRPKGEFKIRLGALRAPLIYAPWRPSGAPLGSAPPRIAGSAGAVVTPLDELYACHCSASQRSRSSECKQGGQKRRRESTVNEN